MTNHSAVEYPLQIVLPGCAAGLRAVERCARLGVGVGVGVGARVRLVWQVVEDVGWARRAARAPRDGL